MNKILKQRARQLYGANAGKLLGVYAIFFVYMLLTVLLPTMLLETIGAGWNLVLQVVIMLVASPLALGVLRYTYRLQKGARPTLGEVFHYFGGLRRYGKAVQLSFVQAFPSYITMVLATATQASIANNPLLGASLSMAMMLTYVFVIYWVLHAALMSYILVEDENAEVGHIRKESFRLMKGNCGKFFLLNLSFVGWYILVSAVLVVVLVAVLMPMVMRSMRMGLTVNVDSVMLPYLLWIEVAVYGIMTFLEPYVALANAGFADVAIQGRLGELEWQGRQAPWQPPYPQQYQNGWQQPPAQGQPGWNNAPPAWGQQAYGAPQAQPGPAFTPAQQEEASQYPCYQQGRPMAPRIFVVTAQTERLEGFLPWPMVEQSNLYSFLKLEGWMAGMIAESYRLAAAEMSAAPQGMEHSLQKSLTEVVNGTQFCVTTIIEEKADCPGYTVTIRVELSAQS